LNYKLRKTSDNEEKGENKDKAPSHALFFIPVQFWAIIIPVFFVWAGYSEQQAQYQDKIYLQEPQSGDLYLTDFSKVFTDTNSSFKYGIMKVATSTDDNKVKLLIGQLTYVLHSGPEKDITNNKTMDSSYFSEDIIILNLEEIQKLYSLGGIYRILR